MSDNNNAPYQWTPGSQQGTPEKGKQSATYKLPSDLGVPFGELAMAQAIQNSMESKSRQQAEQQPVMAIPTIENPYEAINQLPVAAIPLNLNQQLNFDMSAMLAAGTLPPVQSEQRPSLPPQPQHNVAARPGAIMDFTSELMKGFASSITEQAKSATSAVTGEIIGQVTNTDVHASLRRQQERLAEQRRILQAMAPQIRRQHSDAQQVQIQNLSQSRDYGDTMRRMQNEQVAKEMDQAKDVLRAASKLSTLDRFKAIVFKKEMAENAEKTVMKRIEAKKKPPQATAKAPSGPGAHLNKKQSMVDKGGRELSGAGGVQ